MLVELFVAKVIADSFISKKKPLKKEILKEKKKDQTYETKRYNALRKAGQAEIDNEANRLINKSKGLL